MNKKAMKGIAIIVFLNSMLSLQASIQEKNEEQIVDLEQKVYVQTDQIYFDSNRIYINIDDFTYETPALSSDDSGYYIDTISKKDKCSWYHWQCTNCKTCNLRGVNWECKKCKKPVSLK